MFPILQRRLKLYWNPCSGSSRSVGGLGGKKHLLQIWLRAFTTHTQTTHTWYLPHTLTTHTRYLPLTPQPHIPYICHTPHHTWYLPHTLTTPDICHTRPDHTWCSPLTPHHTRKVTNIMLAHCSSGSNFELKWMTAVAIGSKFIGTVKSHASIFINTVVHLFVEYFWNICGFVKIN